MKFGVRKDVWGFGDLLICREPVIQDCQACFGTGRPNGTGFLQSCEKCKGTGQVEVAPARTALIQCFPEARFKDHREKMLAIPELQKWKRSGNKVFLHGWALKPKDGVRGAKKVWTLHEEEM